MQEELARLRSEYGKVKQQMEAEDARQRKILESLSSQVSISSYSLLTLHIIVKI